MNWLKLRTPTSRVTQNIHSKIVKILGTIILTFTVCRAFAQVDTLFDTEYGYIEYGYVKLRQDTTIDEGLVRLMFEDYGNLITISANGENVSQTNIYSSRTLIVLDSNNVIPAKSLDSNLLIIQALHFIITSDSDAITEVYDVKGYWELHGFVVFLQFNPIASSHRIMYYHHRNVPLQLNSSYSSNDNLPIEEILYPKTIYLNGKSEFKRLIRLWKRRAKKHGWP